jgi:hypothetical protein
MLNWPGDKAPVGLETKTWPTSVWVSSIAAWSAGSSAPDTSAAWARHEQQHAFFAFETQRFQSPGKATDLLGQLAIAERSGIVDQRCFIGACRVAGDQVLGKVEFGGRWGCVVHAVSPSDFGFRCSSGPVGGINRT